MWQYNVLSPEYWFKHSFPNTTTKALSHTDCFKRYCYPGQNKKVSKKKVLYYVLWHKWRIICPENSFFIHSNQRNCCHSLQYFKGSTCALDSLLIWYIFWFFFLSEWNERVRFTAKNEFSPPAEKKPQQNADLPA